jgi:DNA polymerase bacteriophage-type
MLDLVAATPDSSPLLASVSRRALVWDAETFSTTSIKTFGAHKYAAHPSTDVWLFSYAADDGPFRVWLRGDPVPQEFIDAAADPNWIVVAHNASFEFSILRHVLGPKYGFPPIPIEQWRCTMAMARAAGLPAKLGLLGKTLDLTNQKDAAGERLMRAMAAPRKPHKGEPPGLYYRGTSPNISKLCVYSIADGEAARELYRRAPPLSDSEQKLWVLDHKINSRGFCVDREFAQAALKIAQATGPEINAELGAITNNEVNSINKVAALIKWLDSQGCHTRTLKREVVEGLLEGDLPAPVRRVLELRLGGAQAAAKKIVSLLARAGDDGRVRGAFTYHGASTGRWAGEGFQPQNLKRPIEKDLESARAIIATGDLEFVKSKYAKPLAIIGDCIRSTIVAAPGHTLIGADFSSIESRALAHIAGEKWKLDAYRRFDATKDPNDEPYCVTACKIYRVPQGTFDRESPERTTGKTCELAFGYQGGLKAFRNFSDEFTDTEVDEFKVAWRLAHPAVVRFWYGVDDAAIHAVRTRKMVRYGLLLFKVVGGFLQVKLPSGRKLSYAQPRLILDDRNRARVVFKDNGQGRFIDCRGGQGAYGGMWTENFVSAIARDLLVEAMFRLEAAGYPITMTVHDEIIAEVPEGFGSTQEFTRLMTRRPAWAEDLPIAANAWTGPRYLK